jgi:AraC-like DNA-binding protein
MENILKIDNIQDYNLLKGIQTKHPLISSFDNSKTKALPNGKMILGFYSIFLKGGDCGELTYGRNSYDYQNGTLVFVGPGQVLGINNKDEYQPQGLGLQFHPDFIKGTNLSQKLNKYSFFSYELNEALHLSEKERLLIIDLLVKIDHELEQSIDKHTKEIIVNYIEQFLNYCERFYDRQFITRENINQGMLANFEKLLNNYFQSENPEHLGLPSVSFFAEELNLSPNYFGDLVKKETGKSALDHIHLKLLDVAKERIFDPNKTISEIAYEVGFKYPQHFNRMFKKSTGYTPNEYRSLN